MEEKYRNKKFEKILDQRAKEDLEKKSMEKARNEYNFEQYMKKKERVENKARRKIRAHSYKGVIIFTIIMVTICIILSLEQQGIHIMDIIKTILPK